MSCKQLDRLSVNSVVVLNSGRAMALHCLLRTALERPCMKPSNYIMQAAMDTSTLIQGVLTKTIGCWFLPRILANQATWDAEVTCTALCLSAASLCCADVC